MKCSAALVFLSLLALGAAQDADHTAKEEAPLCYLKDFQLRTSLGEAIQWETAEDGSITGTMCSKTPNFRVMAAPSEPLFGAATKCELHGAPESITAVKAGASAEFELVVWTLPRDVKKEDIDVASVAWDKENSKWVTSEAENAEDLKERIKVTVNRLGVSEDQEKCTVTRVRSAAEDCGYAPMLEAQRQVAALNPGLGLKVPNATKEEVAAGESVAPNSFLQARPKKANQKSKKNVKHHKGRDHPKSAKWRSLKKGIKPSLGKPC